MTSQTVQARVSPELKHNADSIFLSIGLTTSDAIRIFLQQSVNIGGLPFQLLAKQPNKTTIAAIKELKSKRGKKFTTTTELFGDLDI